MNANHYTLKVLKNICRHFNISISMDDYKQLTVFCHSGVGKIYGYRPKMNPYILLELMHEYSDGKPFPKNKVLPNGLTVSDGYEDVKEIENDDDLENRKEKHERDCRRRDLIDGIPGSFK